VNTDIAAASKPDADTATSETTLRKQTALLCVIARVEDVFKFFAPYTDAHHNTQNGKRRRQLDFPPKGDAL
jgi:hypothetical protein